MRQDAPNIPADLSAADLLRRTLDLNAQGPVSLGEALQPAGARGHALGLAVFALPEALPIPLAGVSLLLALPLVLISTHLLLAGGRTPLPQALLRRRLDPRLLRAVGGKALALLRRVERISRPRLTRVVRQERLLAGACLLLALIVALPIPFWNMPPAICLLLISVGMLQRDGGLALVGLLGLLAMVLAAASLGDVLVAWVAR